MVRAIVSKLYYDLLIIGAGGAGITAAIEAAKCEINVAVISKVHPLHSHTNAAQGGINASLCQDDDWRWHMYDTIKGSDWLADQDAVEILCKSAPNAIAMLDSYGVMFDRDHNGNIQQKVYGGQTTHFGAGELAKRVCSVADSTGSAIMQALYQTSIDLGVEYFNYHYAINFVDTNSILCLDIASGQFVTFAARSIIIATGGCSQIYATSTSSSICTGDGHGLIWHANLPLQDMEFVQFHPTALQSGVLITEAARALGGRLINNLSERFMSKYAHDRMELACRDIVARAIAQEIAEHRGCGANKDHILLDLTHIAREDLLRHVPGVLETCKQMLDIDPASTPIPIAPAAHYMMGGIPTNIHCQVVDEAERVVPGLYAIGEAACVSVHGANRLGCNSLLDLFTLSFANKTLKTAISQSLKTEALKKIIINFIPNNINDFFQHKKWQLLNILPPFIILNNGMVAFNKNTYSDDCAIFFQQYVQFNNSKNDTDFIKLTTKSLLKNSTGTEPLKNFCGFIGYQLLQLIPNATNPARNEIRTPVDTYINAQPNSTAVPKIAVWLKSLLFAHDLTTLCPA